MRVRCNRTRIFYSVKQITCLDDTEFHQIIREVVVHRYLQEIMAPKIGHLQCFAIAPAKNSD
jgi:hypothetical protein